MRENNDSSNNRKNKVKRKINSFYCTAYAIEITYILTYQTDCEFVPNENQNVTVVVNVYIVL